MSATAAEQTDNADAPETANNSGVTPNLESRNGVAPEQTATASAPADSIELSMIESTQAGPEENSVDELPTPGPGTCRQCECLRSLTSSSSTLGYLSSDDVISNGLPRLQGSSGALACASTSSASVCRICQLGMSETGEVLNESDCGCKGYMGKVHRSCQVEWVLYKGSNMCEICRRTFSTIPPPPTHQNRQSQRETLRALAWQLEQVRPFSRRKRTAVAAIIVFLVVVTSVTAILTVGADREVREMINNPWVTQSRLRQSGIVFSVCVAFLFFCATLTLGLLMLWIGLECCFSVHRRRIIRRAALEMRDRQANSVV